MFLFGIEEFLNVVEYRVARRRDELERSYELVYQEYLKRGYVEENPVGMRCSLHNALPETTTFVAVTEKKVVATATLVPDSPLGLPMDSVYHEELQELRGKNIKLCEVTMLASNTDLFKKGVSAMLYSRKMFFVFFLFKLVYDYAKGILKPDYICITVNPKHKLTYDFLLFEELAGLRPYKGVNDAPAIAMYLNLNTVEQRCEKKNASGVYKMFLAPKTVAEKFEGKLSLTAEDLRYFFLKKSDVLKQASPAALEYIKSCYPAVDFSKIL